LNLTTQASQLGRGETYEDTGRVLSRYVDGIMFRTFEQVRAEKMAHGATVPVINGLSDLYHPCQLMADMFTVQERKGNIGDLTIAYVGDGNNMANSWIVAAIILGFQLRIATPKGYEPAAKVLDKIGTSEFRHIEITHDAEAAVKDADVVNTDTWISMGQEGDKEAEKKELFAPYQVNSELMLKADPDAIVLHCLPAHRNEEITDEIMLALKHFHIAPRRLKDIIIYGFKRSFFAGAYLEKRGYVRKIIDFYDEVQKRFGVESDDDDITIAKP